MTMPSESYESGYDPKYGYNRNAFKHKTPVTSVLSKVVKLVTMPVDLASEAIAHNKDKKRRPSQQPADPQTRTSADAGRSSSDGAYVELPADRADALIKSGQAVPVEGAKPTHRLVDEGVMTDEDEADWTLDEAASDIYDEKVVLDQEVSAVGPPPEYQTLSTAVAAASSSHKELPFPVIVPQRRPRTKTRGFVRAYAPVLAKSGISQDSFLAFLKSLHQASQANPILNVIQIGAGLAGIYPDIIVASVAQAIQVGAAVVQELQERWRTNRFMDQANKDLFMPHGLYAMIVTYKPTVKGDEYVSTKTVDMGAVEGVAKYGMHLTKSSSTDKEAVDEKTLRSDSATAGQEQDFDNLKDKAQNRLHLSSAKSRGESEMPIQCAPLIYPALESKAAASEGRAADAVSALKTKSSRGGAFINDYFDRRARTIETTANPNSTLNSLAGGKPGFKSKMGDPNDARNTHLITLLTGGKIKAEPLGAKRRWEKAQKKESERVERLKHERAQAIARGEVVGPIEAKKRFMQEDILYLMIVNMPSEAELAKARADIESRKQKND